MKKTISVLLAVLMIVMCVPLTAGAATTKNLTAFQATLSSTEASQWIIPAGVTVTVPNGSSLSIQDGVTLTVAEGGTLNLLGSCNVLEGGTLLVDGNIINAAAKLHANADASWGVAKARVRFPALSDYGLRGKIRVSVASGNAYDDLNPDFIYNNIDIDTAGQDLYFPLNKMLFIKAEVIEHGDENKYDDQYQLVYLSGVEVPYGQGMHSIMLGNAGDISFSEWDEEACLRQFKIEIPAKDGYAVYGRYGEQSLGSAVYLKYGKPFSFRVDVDPDYDKSPYAVYIVEGYGINESPSNLIKNLQLEPAAPDADGYYTIPSVKSDYTIYVLGVIDNATVDKVSGIFEMVKNVFDMIVRFFKQLLGMLGINTAANADG